MIKTILHKIADVRAKLKFKGSVNYWEGRYQKGGNSGVGSYGHLADYKAKVLNDFVAKNHIQSVLEFGCGDGNQLSLAKYPMYLGLDVSAIAIRHCMARFAGDTSKSFYLYESCSFSDNAGLFKADLAISLDVIYHLIEDDVYEQYMQQLFRASNKYVVIYAWDSAGQSSAHVRHRKFSDFIKRNIKGWKLAAINSEIEKPQDACDFYFYEKI